MRNSRLAAPAAMAALVGVLVVPATRAAGLTSARTYREEGSCRSDM